MTFTTIDVPGSMDVVLTKHTAAINGAADPAAKSTAVKACMTELAQEIGRLMGIYQDEEGKYAKEISSLHEKGKAVTIGVERTLDTLRKKFDEAGVRQIEKSVVALTKLQTDSTTMSSDLTAHQGARNSLFSSVPTAAGLITQPNVAKLDEIYKRRRQFGIDAVANAKDPLKKIDEFVLRAESCLKAARALSKGATADTAEIGKELTEIDAALSTLAHNADGKADAIDKMKTFMEKQKKKAVTAGEVKGEIPRAVALSNERKRLNAQLQTLQLRYDNLKKSHEKFLAANFAKQSKDIGVMLKSTTTNLTKFAETEAKYQPALAAARKATAV